MNHEQILSLVRQLLLFAGGFVVAMGWLDEQTMLAIAGAAATIIASVWALWTRTNKSLVAQAATIVPVSDASQAKVGIEIPVKPAAKV